MTATWRYIVFLLEALVEKFRQYNPTDLISSITPYWETLQERKKINST